MPSKGIEKDKSEIKRVVLWGATGQAKVLNEALPSMGACLSALVDRRCLRSPWPDVEMLTGEPAFIDWLQSINAELHFAVAIGGDRGRDRIAIRHRLIELGLTPLTVVHTTAFVATDAIVGQACQILANASVCSFATLEDSVIVNTRASVDHDSIIREGTHIAPGAIITGEVDIGPRSFIGAGAVVLPRLQIGADCIVGAGAVVTKNIPANTTVVGIPARPVK